MRKQLFSLSLVSFLAACASGPSGGSADLPAAGTWTTGLDDVQPAGAQSGPRRAPVAVSPARASGDQGAQVETRRVPRLIIENLDGEEAPEELPKLANRTINVTIPPQSPAAFVNTVFGELLEVGFVIGPGVEARQEQIAMRSVQGMKAQELFDVAVNTLEEYGIGVYYQDGLLNIVEFEDLKRAMPRFVRARARVGVPSGLRPVVQFVELVAIDSNEMGTILKETFPNERLAIAVNRGNNSLTLNGLPEDVDQALRIINAMDVAQFADTEIATFRPNNWKAADLAAALERQLTFEGYAVSTQSAALRPISILAIPVTNQLSIFVKDPDLRAHVLNSARRLDAAAAPTGGDMRTYVYRAQHYDAKELVGIVDAVLTNMANRSGDTSFLGNAGAPGTVQLSAGPLAGGAASDPAAQTGPVAGSGRITVDTQGNRLVFYGTEEEYSVITELLKDIDTPAAEVLLEVTIAEITLTDDTRSGLEFLFQQIGSKGFAIGAGTAGGLGLTTGGLSGQFTSGDYVVDFSALSSNNQINVLSEPSIVTKSGSSASINVGTEVPIITSQRAAATQSAGSTDVLQTVQYRNTGIILDIEPIVYSDYRIDLTIDQEVSAAQANENQAIASPVISNRSIKTELSLQDGQSAILGGLIENRFTRGQTGVPILKDLPLIGRLFKTETLSSNQTILMVMITPYVISQPGDRDRIVDRRRDVINDAFQRSLGNPSGTLLGPREIFRVPGGETVADPVGKLVLDPYAPAPETSQVSQAPDAADS